jgi:hypothetical protein
MNLDEAQKQKVANWIAEGLKLSDIQKRIASDLGVNLTYMEVRFLVDDLKLTPKDAERAKTPELGRVTPAAPESTPPPGPAAKPAASAPAPPGRKPGGVSVTVDELARPGAMVSGKVTFSDGNVAEWFLDQTGRLGLSPVQQGYRPSPQDVQSFQTELQNELARFGF